MQPLNISPAKSQSAGDVSAAAAHSRAWTPDRKAIWLTFIVVIGFIASTAWHYYLTAYYNVPYPLDTYLFRTNDRFNDFFNGLKYAFDVYNVPAHDRAIMPTSMLFFRILANGIISPKIEFALFVALFTYGALWFVTRHLPFADKRLKWLIGTVLVCFSYPFIFCVDRGNVECMIFLILCMFVWEYSRGNTTRAFIWAGLALAMKPYAGVFFAVFLADNKILPAVKAGIIAVVLTIIGFFILHGEWAVLRKSGEMYNQAYVVGNEGFYLSASLWTAMKAAIDSFTSFGLVGFDCRPEPWNIHLPFASHYLDFTSPQQVHEFFEHLMHSYFIFSAVAFVLVVGCLCIFRMEFWKKIAVVTCCMNLLPYICGHYRLMHLFLATALFIATSKRSRLDPLYVAIFGLLLIPKSYIHFAFAPVFQANNFEVSDSIFIDPFLMSALTLLILGSAIAERSWTDLVLAFGSRLGWKLRQPQTSQQPANMEINRAAA